MVDRRLTVLIFTTAVVVAFAWVVYFVVAAQIGSDIGSEVGLSSVTVLSALVLVVIELLIRRWRAESRRETGGPVPDRRFVQLLTGTAVAIVGLWIAFFVSTSVVGFDVGIFFGPLFLTILLVAGDVYIWFEMFRKT
jgi:uncharacterized protein YacL